MNIDTILNRITEKENPKKKKRRKKIDCIAQSLLIVLVLLYGYDKLKIGLLSGTTTEGDIRYIVIGAACVLICGATITIALYRLFRSIQDKRNEK